MGSGTGSPRIPPGRQKTDDGEQTTEGRKKISASRVGPSSQAGPLDFQSSSALCCPSSVVFDDDVQHGMDIEDERRSSSNERLGPVSSTHCCACTPGLSTWWSTTALQGELVSRWVSRLDAFSDYPVRT